MKALFVCTGNSCRSVMAEYLFNHAAARLGLQGWKARSCGTAAQRHFPIPRPVLKVLSERGIPEVKHAPQLVNPELIRWADSVYAMSAGHCEALKALYPDSVAKIRLFLQEAGLGEEDVEDPIGKSEEVYVKCCELISQGVEGLIQNHAARKE